MDGRALSANQEPPLTVWFDGGCPLCRREIAWMKRQTAGRAVRYVDVEAREGCPIDPRDLLSRFHAQEQGGPLVSGAGAFAALWRRSRALRPLGLAARWPPLLWLMERAYCGFLRIRPRLRRLASDVAEGG
jgi:predicted DCC family thiol-disulfide oxidoreductase YuxK